jgi:peroxiredoxin
MSAILPAGTPAPDFTLHVTPDQTLSLSELRGRPVVLAFYPADWSPVCSDELSLYNETLKIFSKRFANTIKQKRGNQQSIHTDTRQGARTNESNKNE